MFNDSAIPVNHEHSHKSHRIHRIDNNNDNDDVYVNALYQ